MLAWLLSKLFPPRLSKLRLTVKPTQTSDDWPDLPSDFDGISLPRYQNGIERTQKGYGAEAL